MPPLRICLASAEVSPFAKTGGLGDVTGALARYLWKAGQDVRLFFPFYSSIDTGPHDIGPVDFIRHLGIRLGRRTFEFSAFCTTLPRTELQVYLVHCPELYHRRGLYADDGDEHLRFAMLGRAALECCQRMGWAPDVVHCNDWHTALMPLDLKTHYAWDKLFARSRTVLTLHNVGYQGVFGAGVVDDLDFAAHASLLFQDDLSADRLNFLKTGILYADVLTTVSPTHAHEIQTEQYGMGLDDLLRRRHDHLVGILNGVDYEEWDPAIDPHLPFHYTADDLDGKEQNKRALLQDLSLRYAPGVPALGIVSRLTGQKGIDLYYEVLPPLLRHRDVRLVALGSGEPRYEEFFAALQREFPGKACFYRGFHNPLAHRIEAGCDLFLMPSLYEPCGLNQMYSQRYGTVPVVRKTGGLADAVDPWDPTTGRGTGFLFDHYTPDGLAWAIARALETYNNPDHWRRLIANGMSRDFSWERQTERYVDLYRRLAGG